MNVDKINKIASELAEKISKEFRDEKKLVISDITVEQRGRNVFREFFNIGFWVGDGFIYKFFKLGEASASATLGSLEFIDVETDISYEEAREILSKVKEILSQKFEIEYYYDDDDDDYY